MLRAHPAARQAEALDAAATAERRAGRLLPDPVAGFAWDRAAPLGGPSGREREWSMSQTVPWPGTFSAGVRAADRQADVSRAEAEAVRWDLEVEARGSFARLVHARAVVAIAAAAEADARALRDLAATRAELGEAREADRLKAEIEWLRERQALRAAERETESAEAVVRALAVEPLPRPLAVKAGTPEFVPAMEPAELSDRLERLNPAVKAARAAAGREAALASAARRGRIPDLDVTVFRSEELDKTATGFQVAVKVPLWNANRGAIARAEAAAALVSAAARRKLLELAAELERTRQALDVAAAHVESLEREVLPAATRSLELSRLSYGEGETSLLDLLDAQRTFRETQREAATARLSLTLALGELQRLVGPGFRPWR